MKLKAQVKSLTEIDKAYQDLYTQVGDVFVLDIDDSEYKSKLSEFRDTNITLQQQLQKAGGNAEEIAKLQEMLKGFEGLDAAEAREAMEKMRGIEEKNLIDAGKLDEVVAQRVERMRADFEGKSTAMTQQLQELQEQRDRLNSQLTTVVIDNDLQRAVGEVATVRAGAMQDILSRGRSIWSLDENGAPVPMQNKEVMYSKDGKQQISMTEWAQSLLMDAPYLFEPNSGGGAGGNKDQPNNGGKVVLGDQNSLNDNIEAIAAGEVTVQST